MTGFKVENDGFNFVYVDPPFCFNAPHVSAYPVEVTGWHLLRGIRNRLGLPSFDNKRILDFGCGVRFAKTIANLDIPVGHYCGVDIHQEAILWLKENLSSSRYSFHHLNARNVYYNPEGQDDLGADALTRLGIRDMDVAVMISVITHQSPAEADLTFRQLRNSITTGGHLYFTTFVDEMKDDYWEQDEAAPGHMSTYRPAALMALLESSGWRFKTAYEKSTMQQTAFVCEAV